MTKNKFPYRITAKSFKDIIQEIMNHASFRYFSAAREYRILLIFNFFEAYRDWPHGINYIYPQGEYRINNDPEVIKEWENHFGSKMTTIVNRVYSEVMTYFLHDNWTPWPGEINDGRWKLRFCEPKHRDLYIHTMDGFRINRFTNIDKLEGYLRSLSWKELYHVYKVVVCIRNEITPTNAIKMLENRLNYYRHEWETEQGCLPCEMISIMSSKYRRAILKNSRPISKLKKSSSSKRIIKI